MNLILSIKNLKVSGVATNLSDILFKNSKETIKHNFNFLFYFAPKKLKVINGKVIQCYKHLKNYKRLFGDEEYQQICVLATLEFKSELMQVENSSKAFWKIAIKSANLASKLCYKELNYIKRADFEAFRKLEEKRKEIEDISVLNEFEDVLTSIELKTLLACVTAAQRQQILRALKRERLHSN